MTIQFQGCSRILDFRGAILDLLCAGRQLVVVVIELKFKCLDRQPGALQFTAGFINTGGHRSRLFPQPDQFHFQFLLSGGKVSNRGFVSCNVFAIRCALRLGFIGDPVEFSHFAIELYQTFFEPALLFDQLFESGQRSEGEPQMLAEPTLDVQGGSPDSDITPLDVVNGRN